MQEIRSGAQFDQITLQGETSVRPEHSGICRLLENGQGLKDSALANRVDPGQESQRSQVEAYLSKRFEVY